MGTKCAPSYANIFMGWFEEKFIFPLLTNLSDFYLRFIDDIFLIWNGTKSESDNFLKKINQCHPSMLNQAIDKVIYTANPNILIPLRKVLPIARH